MPKQFRFTISMVLQQVATAVRLQQQLVCSKKSNAERKGKQVQYKTKEKRRKKISKTPGSGQPVVKS